jgi:hypothetical protein
MTFNQYNIGIICNGVRAEYNVTATSEGAAGRQAAQLFQGEYNTTWQPTVTHYTLTRKDVQEDD